jgi:hypothetical protein
MIIICPHIYDKQDDNVKFQLNPVNHSNKKNPKYMELTLRNHVAIVYKY